MMELKVGDKVQLCANSPDGFIEERPGLKVIVRKIEGEKICISILNQETEEEVDKEINGEFKNVKGIIYRRLK